jgi:UDP-N-acetylglucosamine--N-acetylmuramyl-(pentapeptide) pyrophosphoryl-undecaprenol N-acetylglucosamine transferase
MPYLQFIHISGPHLYGQLRDAYRRAGTRVFLREFTADMPAVYRAADASVSRAGASTIAELSLIGIPAVLVPFPYAMDDHQRANAEAVAASGGAVVLDDRDIRRPGGFLAAVRTLCEDEKKRRVMAEGMRKALPSGASEAIAEDIRSLI